MKKAVSAPAHDSRRALSTSEQETKKTVVMADYCIVFRVVAVPLQREEEQKKKMRGRPPRGVSGVERCQA